MKKILVLLFVFLTGNMSFANDTAKVLVRAKADESHIRLRWAVNSPAAWILGNQYGYKLERFTVMRDSLWLPTAEKKVLSEALKPQPLDDWQTIVPLDNYAAVIAQAIYGESFEMDAVGPITAIVYQSMEQEQRYFMALYAADHSFEAACMAGLGWTDTDVRRGEKYLYRITPLLKAKDMLPEEGAAYIALDDYEQLPKPQGLAAQFGDLSVLLIWDYQMLEDVYGSYFVEKSDDSRHFQRLNKTPIVPLNDETGEPQKRLYFADTLAQNNTSYYYRVIGVDAFGDEGPPSDTIQGRGQSVLRYTPQITHTTIDDNNAVHITWEFESAGEQLIKEFVLERSNSNQGPFITVVENIRPSQRAVSYDKLASANYFRIAAVPYAGEPRFGFSVLVQPVDSIPPTAPAGLHGSIDSLGIARLAWLPNAEDDMLGYRIYRSLAEGEELIPLTDVAIRDTVFVDTLQMYNLNPKAYYAVTALDHRYNQSEQSAVCVLTKPNLIPPSAPLIVGYESLREGILLRWERSSDPEAAHHLLHRKLGISEQIILQFNDTLSYYVDTTVVNPNIYHYYMTAVNAFGLSSPPSPTVAVKAAAAPQGLRSVSSFNVTLNRNQQSAALSWEHKLPDVQTFLIYRAFGDEPLSLWKSVDGDQKAITDTTPWKETKKFRYAVRPVLQDGRYGEMTDKEVKL